MTRNSKFALCIMLLLSLVFTTIPASAEDFTEEIVSIPLDQAMGYLEDEIGIIPTLIRDENNVPFAICVKWDTENQGQLLSGATFAYNPDNINMISYQRLKKIVEEYNYSISTKETWVHLMNVILYVNRNLEATDVAINFYPHEIGDGVAITGTSALIGNFKIDLYGDVWLLYTGDGYPLINEKSYQRIKDSVAWYLEDVSAQ
ncbi:MAG: hypothetical protein IJX99_04040 [Clostridia bacterium]|nr:hypothetical protein [Clostridia bacterium]